MRVSGRFAHSSSTGSQLPEETFAAQHHVSDAASTTRSWRARSLFSKGSTRSFANDSLPQGSALGSLVASGCTHRLRECLLGPRTCTRYSLNHIASQGTCTLLFQREVGGLQVRLDALGTDEPVWLDVQPREGCLVVNIGDALE